MGIKRIEHDLDRNLDGNWSQVGTECVPRPSHLQSLMDQFVSACTDFRLTINLKKTKAQATKSPNITIKNYELEVVDVFTDLGSTISSKLFLDKELDELAWQPLRLPASEHVCGKIPDSLSKPKWQSIMLVFLVNFYMEVSDGQHMLLMSVD